MKLEDQVCSLELAKQLKELGVKQKSYFQYWTILPMNGHPRGETQIIKAIYDDSVVSECVSAFTVAELGEMLPNTTNGFQLRIENIQMIVLMLDIGKLGMRMKDVLIILQ